MEEVIREVESLVENLWAQIKNARSIACINDAFSKFYCDPRLDRARYEANESAHARKQITSALRKGMQPIYQESAGWRHILEKPYGYPGDFEVLELVYDQKPHPATTSELGKLIDIWSETTTLPKAVVARKNALRVYLENVARSNTKNEKAIAVLSVGAGSAREIREIGSDLRHKIHFTLLDSDARPLDFAGSYLSTDGKISLQTMVGDAIRNDLRTMLGSSGYDLVYSFGVVDYLPDKYAIRLLNNCRQVLSPNGRILFCIKDARYYEQWFYDWLYDWRFISRTSDDGAKLAEAAGLKVTQQFNVEGGVIKIFECCIKS